MHCCTRQRLWAAPLGAIVLILTICMSAPAHADGPKGSTSEAEVLGCQSEGYDSVADFWLRHDGRNREDIGYLDVMWRVSPSEPRKVRVCALTRHTGKTYDEPRLTVVRVGSEDRGGGNRTWYFLDRDPDARMRSDGRAITPGFGRCAVVQGKIRHNGRTFTRTITHRTSGVVDDHFCS